MSTVPTATLERWLRILIDAGQFGTAEQVRRELLQRNPA